MPTNVVADLTKVAEIIISLPVSAAGPERTLSLFDWIQSQKTKSHGHRQVHENIRSQTISSR